MMVPRRYSFRVYLLAFALALLAVATTSNAHPVLTAAEAEQMGTKTTANDTEDNSETNIDAIVRDRPRTLIGTTNNRANGNSLTLAEVEVLVPEDTREFLDKLTVEDRAVLRTVLAKSASYSNMREVLTDLRNSSTILYTKAVELVTGIRRTIAGLSKPARDFVDQAAAQAQSAFSAGVSVEKLRTEAAAIVRRYRALSETTREELKRAFPIVARVVTNPTFKMLASGMLGINADEEEPAATTASSA